MLTAELNCSPTHLRYPPATFVGSSTVRTKPKRRMRIQILRVEHAMETILYFLFWAGLIFIMMRFGCGAHVMGHGKSGATRDKPSGSAADVRWTAPETDTDPVCGITVQTRNSKSAVYEGHVYYFCSRECRERFEAAPDSYLAETKGTIPDMTEQAHG